MRIKIEKVTAINAADLVRRSNVAQANASVKTLKQWINVSVAVWVGSVDGVVACVWGVVQPSIISDRAYLWLLTTGLVDDHKFLFVRYSQRCVEYMLKQYGILIGHCVINNDRAIRWLKWLGATFGDYDGETVPFQIVRKTYG